MVQGFADLVDPALTGPQVVAGCVQGGADGDPVPAGVLGLVHRDVGVDQQVLRGPGPIGVEARHPDARRDPQRPALTDDDRLGAQRLEEPVQDALGVIGRRARQHGGELVATEATDEVTRTQRPGEQVRDLDEQAVARRMPAAVVDVLEAVEVEHGHGSGEARAGALRDDPVDLDLEEPAVREVGQRIVTGEVLQLVAGAAQLPPGTVERGGGPADLILHVVERPGHHADLVAARDRHPGRVGAGPGGVEVAAPQGAHRPGQLRERPGRESGGSLGELDRAVRDHPGQDQPDRNGQHRDDDEDVLQHRDQCRAAARDRRDGQRVAGAVEGDDGQHGPGQFQVQAPRHPGRSGATPVGERTPGVEHRTRIGQRQAEQHGREPELLEAQERRRQPRPCGNQPEGNRPARRSPGTRLIGGVPAQQPHRDARQPDAEQVGEVRGREHPDRVPGEQEDQGCAGGHAGRDPRDVEPVAALHRTRQQAVLGELGQGAGRPRERLDGAVEHVQHQEPDGRALSQRPEQRDERRPQAAGQLHAVGVAQTRRAEDPQPDERQHHEVDGGHGGAGQHRPWQIPHRMPHLPDVTRHGFERRRREADQVQPRHRTGHPTEHPAERGRQVPAERLRRTHVAVQQRQQGAEQRQ